MSSQPMFRHARRSTRVSLKITIEVDGIAGPLKTQGETIVVNLHGALISTVTALVIGMKISVHVYLTDKQANARVVYADPEQPLHCGIELDKPQNIWGVSLPPHDGLEHY